MNILYEVVEFPDVQEQRVLLLLNETPGKHLTSKDIVESGVVCHVKATRHQTVNTQIMINKTLRRMAKKGWTERIGVNSETGYHRITVHGRNLVAAIELIRNHKHVYNKAD